MTLQYCASERSYTIHDFTQPLRAERRRSNWFTVFLIFSLSWQQRHRVASKRLCYLRPQGFLPFLVLFFSLALFGETQPLLWIVVQDQQTQPPSQERKQSRTSPRAPLPGLVMVTPLGGTHGRAGSKPLPPGILFGEAVPTVPWDPPQKDPGCPVSSREMFLRQILRRGTAGQKDTCVLNF